MTTEEKRPRGIARGLLRVAVPVIVLAAGFWVARVLVKTSPHAKQQAPVRQARLVEVQPVTVGNHRAVVHAMGTVQASREVSLQPQVSGKIVKMSDEFMPGGRFREGDMLVEIDPADFKLSVQQRASEVAQIRTELTLELGQQTVAQREYEMLGETIKEEDRALMLRQPQLEQVRAKLQAAEAALAQAKLNLERTTVRAPFNAVVRARNVNLGTQVTTVTALGVVTCTDSYWVEAAVPVDQLLWIEAPGSKAYVLNEAAWGASAKRAGRVIRLLTDLEEQGRMARVLIEVGDPLAIRAENQGQPKLLLGDYVRVKIEGIELKGVAVVDRKLVREGNSVWVMNKQNQLEIRPVEVLFRTRDEFYIRNNLHAGEQLVTTDLSAAVEGMALRTRETPVENKQAP